MASGLIQLQHARVCDQWNSGSSLTSSGKSFTFVINGVPVFAKGGNWIPADSFPTRISKDKYRQLLDGGARHEHEHAAGLGRRHLRTQRFL